MKETKRIYYYFLLGGLGGLNGWFVATLALQNSSSNRLGTQIIYGAILGTIIGLALSAYELIETPSLLRFAKFGSIAALISALAGALALPTAQYFYTKFLSSSAVKSGPPIKAVLWGTLCWILFGGLIGLGQTIKKGTQSWKGIVGGLIGGLTGGFIIELAKALDKSKKMSNEQMVLAISLTFLGAAIGASLSFITTRLQQAWFEVLDGKYKGKTYDVTKYVHPILGTKKSGIIGSSELDANVYLVGDKDILPNHAKIFYSDKTPTLAIFSSEQSGKILVNNIELKSSPLRNRDVIQIGDTKLIYHQK